MSLLPSYIAYTTIDQMFRGLEGILKKGQSHAAETGTDESVYLNWRLAPDMFPLVRQVQVATEFPARGMSRLAGQEVPAFPDNEVDFAGLLARLEAAKAHIEALDHAAIDANPEGDITFPVGKDEMTMTRGQYLLTFLLPNLYFHVSTAYALLRGCGVPLGKRDFLAVGGGA